MFYRVFVLAVILAQLELLIREKWRELILFSFGIYLLLRWVWP